MRPTPHFRYGADPLCLGASFLYLLNRFWAKPYWGGVFPFLREHLDDCLFIPAALPLLLWIFRRLNLRHTDEPPSLREVLEWTAVWSFAFEWLFPRFLHKGTADWMDVLSYVGGAFAAWIMWGRKRNTTPTAP